MAIKTLHITNNYHSSSGGIRIAYQALLEAAKRRSRHVRLVVPGSSDTVQQVGEYGKIYTIRAPRMPYFDSRYRMILPNSFLLSRKHEIWSIIRQEQPDLIEICDKYGLPYLAGLFRKGWARGLPRPTLVGMSCERMEDSLRAYLKGSSLADRFSRWYLGRIYIPQFDFHLANSEYTRDELESSIVAGHARKVAICPVGVDCDLFSPQYRSEACRQRLRKEIGVQDDAVLLLYVGRISPEKNIFLLPQLMRALSRDTSRRYVLLIAGAGPATERLKRACSGLPLGSVHLLGHMEDRAALAELLANCDAFIHPNPREPFGIAPLEAMAAGLPLVAPRSGGVLSYADEHNSWLTLPNAEAFAWKVRNILNDPETRRRKVWKARQTAEAYSWQITTDRLFRLYDDMHAERQTPIPPGELEPKNEIQDDSCLVSRRERN